ncbi:MAG: hypothetical protein IPL05_07550 [Betaproteobacteria bacterium]|nr:hypothetical protein [Betaproteobacteria bacterium]
MTSEYTKTYTGVLTAQDGTRRHFINGAPGRDGDLPAVEYPDGGVVFYRENPKRGGMGQRASLEHFRNGELAVEMARRRAEMVRQRRISCLRHQAMHSLFSTDYCVSDHE